MSTLGVEFANADVVTAHGGSQMYCANTEEVVISVTFPV